jgi:predicted RNase H-like HicB family nuclease
MMNKDLAYYRALPYGREWIPRDDESGRYFVVRLVEIPEIYGCGATKQEALSNLREAFDDQILWALEEGLDIPVPAVIPPEAKHQVRVALVELPRRRRTTVKQGTDERTQSESADPVASYVSSDNIDFSALAPVA